MGSAPRQVRGGLDRVLALAQLLLCCISSLVKKASRKICANRVENRNPSQISVNEDEKCRREVKVCVMMPIDDTEHMHEV